MGIGTWQMCKHIEGILPKGLYPPRLRLENMALLAGYPRYVGTVIDTREYVLDWQMDEWLHIRK